MDKQHIYLIDVYKSFDILGRFNTLQGESLEDFSLKNPSAISQKRELTDMLVWDQYLIAGGDNGCIEVYNSDTLECLFGYGLTEKGVVSLKRVEESLIGLDQKGHISIAHFN